MRNLKRFGTVVVAAMALAAALGTASASAATSFTASALGKNITESTLESHVYTITGSTTQCTNITFTGVTEGTASGGLGFTSTGLKVVPKYEGCTAFGFTSTVTNTNCDYLTTPGGTYHITKLDPAGPECKIDIKVNNFFAKCAVEVTGGQTISGLSFANGAGKDIVVTFRLSGIKAHVLESSGLCPLSVGTHETTYNGKSTFGAEGASIAVD